MATDEQTGTGPADATPPAPPAAKPTAAQRRQQREHEGEREPRFTASRILIEAGTILGESPALVAAAFHRADVDPEDELTRAEAQRHVDRERDRPVETNQED